MHKVGLQADLFERRRDVALLEISVPLTRHALATRDGLCEVSATATRFIDPSPGETLDPTLLAAPLPQA